MLGVMATNKMKAGLGALGTMVGTVAQTTEIQPLSSSAPLAHANVAFETMRIKIVGGRNLAPKDVNGLSDPYLNIWCGATGKYKTKIKYNTLNPVWDEDFTLLATTCRKRILDIECWDHDTLCKDEFMGEISIPVDSVPVGQVVSQWYKLMPNANNKNKKGAVSGDICIDIFKL